MARPTYAELSELVRKVQSCHRNALLIRRAAGRAATDAECDAWHDVERAAFVLAARARDMDRDVNARRTGAQREPRAGDEVTECNDLPDEFKWRLPRDRA